MEDAAFVDDELAQFGLSPAVPKARLVPTHAAVVVAVAGLVLVALLTYDGLLFVPPQLSTTLEGAPLSYSEALHLILSLVNQEPGGPWRVSSVLGIGTTIGISGPAPSPISTGNCVEKPVFTGNIEYPATPQSAPAGFVSSWSIEWIGAQGGTLTAVMWNPSVLQGEIIAHGFGNCSTGASPSGGVPEPTIDSTNASRAANDAGGDAGCLHMRTMRPSSS